MSQASIEQDRQAARELSRMLNANPRRSSVPQVASQVFESMELPIPKGRLRFKSSNAGFPVTPISITSTLKEARFDDSTMSSSSLSSLESSDESSSKDSSPLTMLNFGTKRGKLPNGKSVESFSGDTVSNALRSRKPRGLTDMTISEADARSIPPPGPELLEKVDNAKTSGKVPVLYDSSVVRYVDGKWMAPQICYNCQGTPTVTKQSKVWQKCDRSNPCSICTSIGVDCPQGNMMTYVFGTKRLSQPLALRSLDSSEEATIGFSLAAHVSQNRNGTWNSIEQARLCNQRPKKRKAEGSLLQLIRHLGPPLNTGLQMNEHVLDSLEVASDAGAPENDNIKVPNSDIVTVSQLRGRKRKADDDHNDDFVLAPANQGTAIQGKTSPIVGVLKRKTTANRTAGFVKYHQSMQEDKPVPYGQPPVWADKRQSLCETLPYYKAYMSGAYMHCQMVRAFMVDKEVGPRDKFEEEIMISRVGGGRKPDEQSGQMVQKADQDRSIFALGFQRAMENNSPVAIIAGQGNRISTSKLPHYYNVLDWFHVTDVWCEKSTGFKCWMVRLEKIRLDSKSWWASIDSQPLDPNRNIHAIKTAAAFCTRCGTTSKEIYNAGWACLNITCDAYFIFSEEIDDTTLDYNKEFMNERTQFTGEPPGPLAPTLLTHDVLEETHNFGFEKLWNTGIVCPMCKGCSRRIEWRHWRCETPGCTFTHTILQKTMKVHDAIAQGFRYDKEWYDKKIGIRFGQKAMGMYDVYEYIIPGEGKDKIAGIIRHFAANGIINGQPDGPNDLFHFMQERDIGLKRYPARQKGSTGEVLTSHFAANWGAPYKYGVSVLSKGFDEAPPVIIKALKRLTWAGEQTVAETVEPFHPFNELLSIGYFEDTAIGYHDDGEKELGPTVATLSLGSQALMTLRPKAKCNVGAESNNAKGTKVDILRMALRHGDLVVMHGTDIQKLYEHAVKPQGKLRFALTCRYVRPELMANDEERQHAEIKGRLPDGHEQFTYDGDTGKKLIELDEDSENVSAAQRAMNELAARALAGELNVDTLQQCRHFLGGLMHGMGVPEGRATSPPPELMDDA